MLDPEHTAVATLVSMGHILQNNPEVLLRVSKSHPFWQGVVMASKFKIARANVTRTVLVAVGREEPVVPQAIVWVYGSTTLVTNHLDGGTLGADVALVGGCDADCGVRMVHLSIGQTQRQTWQEDLETLSSHLRNSTLELFRIMSSTFQTTQQLFYFIFFNKESCRLVSILGTMVASRFLEKEQKVIHLSQVYMNKGTVGQFPLGEKTKMERSYLETSWNVLTRALKKKVKSLIF